jgi:hypothetical protein
VHQLYLRLAVRVDVYVRHLAYSEDKRGKTIELVCVSARHIVQNSPDVEQGGPLVSYYCNGARVTHVPAEEFQDFSRILKDTLHTNIRWGVSTDAPVGTYRLGSDMQQNQLQLEREVLHHDFDVLHVHRHVKNKVTKYLQLC